MSDNLINHTEQIANIESDIVGCQHTLNETGLFSDESLIRIFETLPEEYIQIYTMGDDHGNLDDFRLGHKGDLNSEELLKAVKEGRLWFNIMQIERFLPEYKKVLNQLFEELEQANPEFKALSRNATLLVSSSNAKVYYHADGPANILWHIRGRKKIYLYPLKAPFADSKDIEKIFSRESNDDLPYDKSFDEHATEFVLEPGQMITWPQNMPHRVDNLDTFCVSLSTEYYSHKSLRKQDVYLANYYLRRWFKLPVYSTNTQGNWSRLKRIVYRIGIKLGFRQVQEDDAEFEFSLK